MSKPPLSAVIWGRTLAILIVTAIVMFVLWIAVQLDIKRTHYIADRAGCGPCCHPEESK